MGTGSSLECSFSLGTDHTPGKRVIRISSYKGFSVFIFFNNGRTGVLAVQGASGKLFHGCWLGQFFFWLIVAMEHHEQIVAGRLHKQ